MTTGYTKTKIEKTFTLSSYENGTHRVDGWSDPWNVSFAESLSPLDAMIKAFYLRPLGTKIKVTMEEIL